MGVEKVGKKPEEKKPEEKPSLDHVIKATAKAIHDVKHHPQTTLKGRVHKPKD